MGPGSGRVRERSFVGWLAGAYTLAFTLWALFGGGSADTRELLSDIAPLPIGFAVSVLAWRASTRAEGDGATRRAWRLIAVAFALWWAGDVTWFFLEAVLHQAPFPSPADAGYLGFYPLLALGLLALPAAPRTRSERVKVALDALTVLLAAAMVVWYLVVEPVVHSGSDSLATALSVGYPVGDLVLLYGLVTTLLRRPGDRPLWLLVGAVSAFVVADVAYAHLSLTDSYAGGDWPDAFWMLAQCLALLAATVQARRPAMAPADGLAKPSGRVSLLPYAGIVIGYALVVAVGHDLAGASFNGLLLGAASITGVVVARQVRVAAENARLVAELHHLAEVDGLTDALNRRSLFEAGERLVRRTQRLGRPLSVLMIDVDHFKTVNDTYGHAAGDDVLAAVVARTMAHVRTADLVGRYGGDELAVVMPDCAVEEAFEVAERIRCAVAGTPITTRSGDIPASVSIGVSGAEAGTSLAGVFGRADGGLYEAKRAGRGRTAVATLAG